jgi:hypothetical protein
MRLALATIASSVSRRGHEQMPSNGDGTIASQGRQACRDSDLTLFEKCEDAAGYISQYRLLAFLDEVPFV